MKDTDSTVQICLINILSQASTRMIEGIYCRHSTMYINHPHTPMHFEKKLLQICIIFDKYYSICLLDTKSLFSG